MLAHTKRHPTEAREIRVIGPADKYNEAIDALKKLGYTDVGDSTPWRDLFDNEELTPGSALRGARYKENFTQKELARKTGIPQGHISAMENGKMGIGKERAYRLAEALHVDYRIFL
jgi:DNA-binding XRE family transcriptional regulator